jgi:Flp pilus assembly protein TadG
MDDAAGIGNVKDRVNFLARIRGGWHLARLRRDQSGSAAVEFAIIAPIFFFLMFLIAETALIFIAEQVMDNAVFETARLIRTGQVQKGGMDAATFKTKVCDRMSVFVNCSSTNFYLDVKSYANFGAMDLSQPLKADKSFKDPGAFNFGQESQIVVMRAYYQWPTGNFFGTKTLASPGMNGKRLIGSFSAFRNEPYGKTG